MLFFFKQKTADDMRISDWSSDVCSSDLAFADANGLLTEAMQFPAVLTTSGEIDDENGVGVNRNLRFHNGQQRSKMYKVATGRLPFKAPMRRRGRFRVVNCFQMAHAQVIEGFRNVQQIGRANV